jgi:DNA-binding MarR family transcriptional regulator
VTDIQQPTKQDAAVRETATRLRVGIGAFKRRTQEALSEGDLTVPQLTALSRLDRLGPSTTAELARREQITPQAMGATIASLERRDLVMRRPDSVDGRRSILSLTPAGQAAIGSGRSAVADQVAVVLAESFTSAEIATLDAAARLLERLAELLLPPPSMPVGGSATSAADGACLSATPAAPLASANACRRPG